MTRPVGVLDPAPPKGSAVLDQKPNPSGMLTIVKLQANRVVSPAATDPDFCCNLDQLWLYVGPSWPSCRSCSSILSNLAPTLLQLGPSLLQLGPTFRQLGPTWSHLAPTWLQLGPILVPTWSNMVPKPDQDDLQEVFSSLSKRSSVFY